jgi:beta-glucosidase/6-phospho-beta-glucosidase/beta-galactosidase
VEGYGNVLRAPLKNYHGYGEYICITNLLTAHARVFHLYDKTYRSKQKGIIGYSIGAQLSINLTDSQEDVEAAQDALQFYVSV